MDPPSIERFRALARSSPWRWSSVGFVLLGDEAERLRAWIHRPNLLRVETPEGKTIIPERRRPRSPLFGRRVSQNGRPDAAGRRLARGRGGRGAGTPPSCPELRPLDPDAPQPEVDADGLVLSRPSRWDLQYDDPMYQSYWWVAMLDPVELADPCWDEPTGEPPVRYTDVTAVEHHGRPAWQAVGVPTWSYDARCVCCPLLDSGPAAAQAEQALGDPVDPDEQDEVSHVVVLDLQTGICVLTRQVGGSKEGSGHDIRIEAVDAPLPDRAFQSADQP